MNKKLLITSGSTSPEKSVSHQTLYAMYEKDKILNSFPPDLAKDVRRVLDMLVMKNDDISSRYYTVNLGGLNIAIPKRVYMREQTPSNMTAVQRNILDCIFTRHKEINRTNLTDIQIRQALQTDVVQKQLELLRFRSTSRAFTEDADIQIQSDGRKLMIRWSNSAAAAQLDVDFETGSFVIS